MGFLHTIKRLTKAILTKSDPFTSFKKVSYSQSGEDIIIEYLFALRKIEKPLCLDIGAYHPVVANNTYKFFCKGSKSINIDANPASIKMFSVHRSTDINLNIGIGSKKGTFDFYIMEDEALNTFSEFEKNNLVRMGQPLKEVQKIKMLPVNEVLGKYFSEDAPDLVSIDAEGVDEDIIQSFDFNNYAPKVICIETISYTPDGTGVKRTGLCAIIEAAGYFEYANTNINSIFVNKTWWFS